MTTKKSPKKARGTSRKSAKPTKSVKPSSLVLNPFTGKFVSTSTSLGKRLEFLISLCNRCPEGSIYNYKTKRCVKPVGKIGKILADEIDFCKKYTASLAAYEKIDVELVKNIGEIELPKKYLGENVKVKELVKVIDDDKVLNKLIKDNLPPTFKDNVYVTFLISILLVILKLVVGGGPVSEFVYNHVSRLIRKANKTFTSVYISTLLNQVKNPDMLNMIYTFSFSSLCLFLVFIYNTFMGFKAKDSKIYEKPLNDLDPAKYGHVKWISLDKAYGIENIYGLDQLINEGIIKIEIDKQTGKKTYKLNAMDLGIQTDYLVTEQEFIKQIIFDPPNRLLTVKYDDKTKRLVDPNRTVTINFNLEIDTKSRYKKAKIEELRELLRKLDKTFKSVGDELENENNKLTAFNIIEGIKSGRYSEIDYTKEAIKNMEKNIVNYTPISDNLKTNLQNNIVRLKKNMELSRETFYTDVGKIELANINAGYDRLKEKIETVLKSVEILTDLNVATIAPENPRVIVYPQRSINANINKQQDQVNYDVKTGVIKTVEETKKELDAAATKRRILQETRDALFNEPKKDDPSKILLKLLAGNTSSSKARSIGSPKKIMPRKTSI